MKNLLVVGSEAFGHGIQLFDLMKLLELDPRNPRIFSQADLSSHWGVVSQGNKSEAWDKLPVGRTHNVVVNEELGYAVAVGVRLMSILLLHFFLPSSSSKIPASRS